LEAHKAVFSVRDEGRVGGADRSLRWLGGGGEDRLADSTDP